jgi:predicted glycoside hydrolase/deacetylase ChbG (UPF0249 family)
LDRNPAEATLAAPERAIVVCLDDYGLHAGVNAAALALAQQGRLSAIGCMVGAPQWRAGAPALATLDRERVDIGLHLDLTEFPLLPGVRAGLSQWLLRSYAGAVDRALLRRELDAQFDAFESALGRPPAYIDGHQHVHQLPVVRDALLAALRARGWAPWLRSTRRPAGGGWGKAWVIETLGEAALRREAKRDGLRQNGHLLGVYGFDGDAARYLALLRAWLMHASEGDVLMCHPALQAPQDDAIGAARVREYAVFAGPQFARVLEDAKLRVAPLTRILATTSGH